MATDIRQQINQFPYAHFVFLGLLIGAAYYFTIFTGAGKYKNQIISLENQATKLQADIDKNKVVVSDLEKFQLEVNQISEQFQAAVEYLPSKSKVEDVLDQLYTLARTTGVSISMVKPSGTRKEKFYELLRVEVQVTGNYGGLTNFLVEVSKLPRIIKIDGVSLRPSGRKNLGQGGKLLDLSGMLITYRYLESSEEAN